MPARIMSASVSTARPSSAGAAEHLGASPTPITYFDALSNALYCTPVLQAATFLLVLWLPRAGLHPRRS